MFELLTSSLSVPHGFTTRKGGVSDGYYSSLNLGLSTGDDPEVVERNRTLVFEHFNVNKHQVSLLEQVHGNSVVVAKPSWHDFKADAQVTNEPDLLLVIGMADCLPILFYDPVRHAIGAAHAGWRGTSLRIAENVVTTMRREYGSKPSDILVVMGPAICKANYQVGAEVFEAFKDASIPGSIFDKDGIFDNDGVFDNDGERYRVDIAGANKVVLEQSGVLRENIEDLSLCTFADPELFYSHRRDGKKRGSHWALIKLG